MKLWMRGGVLCLLMLGGCAAQTQSPDTDTPSTKPSDPQAAWKQRQANFARMTSWRIQGKVGMRFRDQSASFGISWLQNGADNYEMNIKNPLTGSILAYLQGNKSGVTLKANDKTYQDANAERLLRSQLGISLPLDGMKYWVRGIPAPGSLVGNVKLDAQGRPESLQQSGWVIDYSDWQGNDWKALPNRINLTRMPDTKVKVISKDWQTRY